MGGVVGRKGLKSETERSWGAPLSLWTRGCELYFLPSRSILRPPSRTSGGSTDGSSVPGREVECLP